MTPRPSILILLALLAMLAQAAVATSIHKCIVGGKTIYTDKPCDEPRPQATTSQGSPNISLDYTTPYGSWRGQAQYQASIMGQHIPAAHAVVPMTLEVDSQGKVIGASSDNGCRLLGVATPFVGPDSLNLDVSFTGCQFQDYNRRFHGTLILHKAQNLAKLTLRSSIILPGTSRMYDIKATMKR